MSSSAILNLQKFLCYFALPCCCLLPGPALNAGSRPLEREQIQRALAEKAPLKQALRSRRSFPSDTACTYEAEDCPSSALVVAVGECLVICKKGRDNTLAWPRACHPR